MVFEHFGRNKWHAYTNAARFIRFYVNFLLKYSNMA
jgi:hypothetical protein